ncbi:amidase [Paenibacillus harenae]|uniref:Amidase n=2 Tax=Paenibacillus harenae TaxID=306543 RepID=A0ABT9U5J2_PAEHA|nr:amidase [Paenibacillus harenae]
MNMIAELEQWIVEADIGSMQLAMDNGWLSSEQLTQTYMNRIQKYDSKLRSVLALNPDALDIARELDEERGAKGSRGRLHGIPILLKDNIATKDRMHTSAGALALANSFAAADAPLVRQLRLAGAVLLGKTNMTEWANFMASGMWSGYSARGGQTVNPYGAGDLFVGGSSSGSAAAVAANLAAAAIGTETDGSIIEPASQNMVVGIKPTVGLISRTGIIPISHRQDTAGPIARTVTDAAILLGALTAIDTGDKAMLKSDRTPIHDYTPYLDMTYLKQARIGIPRFYYRRLDEERLAIMEEAIARLKQHGATIIDNVMLPCENAVWDHDLLAIEFKQGVNDYLSTMPVASDVSVRNLQDVITFNNNHAADALKYGQDVLEWSESITLSVGDPAYLASVARTEELARERGIDYALKEHQLDALMLPAMHDEQDPAAKAGYPLITVPAGWSEKGCRHPNGFSTRGPFGIAFAGTAYSESTLIRLAYGFEQATKRRFPPDLD